MMCNKIRASPEFWHNKIRAMPEFWHKQKGNVLLMEAREQGTLETAQREAMDFLINHTSDLPKEDHIEIMKILLKNGEPTSTNAGCTMVDLTEIKSTSLWEIRRHVELSLDNIACMRNRQKLLEEVEQNRQEFNHLCLEQGRKTQLTEESRLWSIENVPNYRQIREQLIPESQPDGSCQMPSQETNASYEEVMKNNRPNSKKYTIGDFVSSLQK
ncbi:MAG: hypothetical protein ACYCOU_04360 [Sulfobacillus sp.]